MRFSTFISESNNLSNEATLVLHKIIHMVDNGHVDMGESDIRFTVGPMIHQGAYNKLKVVIRKSETISVKLGKTREGGQPVIVINTKKLPSRDKIDALLSETKVFEGFVAAFKEYLIKLHDHKAEHPQHADEEAQSNTENFEENYNALVAEFGKKIEEFKKASEEVHSHVNNNADIIKHETTKLSLVQLQKEYLGTTENEFLSIIKKLPAFKKFNKVEKELSAKLDTRLKAYYLASVQPLLEDNTEDEKKEEIVA